MVFRPTVRRKNGLQEIKLAEKFNGIEVAVLQDDDSQIYMRSAMLGLCLGYVEPLIAISKIVQRHKYLSNSEFSVVQKVKCADNKNYSTRLFTYKGIIEVAIIAKTSQSDKFRFWIEKQLKNKNKENDNMTENNLKLATTDKFYDVETNIYEGADGEMYMTSEQLGKCLGYSNPRIAIGQIADRNIYLKNSEFSTVIKLNTVDGKNRDVRLFTEDGIYEVTMLAKTEKAKEFRMWVRELIKSLRQGKLQLKSENVVFSKDIIESVIHKYFPITILNQKAINIWKKEVANPLVRKLARVSEKENSECFHDIYEAMADLYGFSGTCAIMNFKDKYNVDAPSTIDVVAENPTYQREFVLAGNRLYDIAKESNPWECGSSEWYSEPIQSDTPPVDKFTIEDKFDTIVNAVADVFGDTSERKMCTLKTIYSRMNTDRGWKVLKTKTHRQTKRSIIEENANQKRKFVNVCNEIIAKG